MRHLRASERPVDIRVITQPFQRQWNGEPEQHLGKAESEDNCVLLFHSMRSAVKLEEHFFNRAVQWGSR